MWVVEFGTKAGAVQLQLSWDNLASGSPRSTQQVPCRAGTEQSCCGRCRADPGTGCGTRWGILDLHFWAQPPYFKQLLELHSGGWSGTATGRFPLRTPSSFACPTQGWCQPKGLHPPTQKWAGDTCWGASLEGQRPLSHSPSPWGPITASEAILAPLCTKTTGEMCALALLQHELGTSKPCALDMQRSQKVVWKEGSV